MARRTYNLLTNSCLIVAVLSALLFDAFKFKGAAGLFGGISALALILALKGSP